MTPATLRWRSAWILSTCVITIGSLMPLREPPPLLPSDKWQHLLAYGVLSWLACKAANRSQRALWLLGTAMVGVIIELLQGLTGYRFFEWGDLLANGVGILLGALLFLIVERYRNGKPH